LLMSEGHAVLTPEGPLPAKELKARGIVLIEGAKGGVEEVILEIVKVDYDGYLWNVMLGEYHEQGLYGGRTTLFANGVLVGDQQLMTNLKEARNKNPEIVRQIIDPMFHKDYQSWLEDQNLRRAHR
jgi:hypothetical protein